MRSPRAPAFLWDDSESALEVDVRRGGQSAYDLSLRGFKTTSNDRDSIMADGPPSQCARFGSPLTANIERIEVGFVTERPATSPNSVLIPFN